MGVSDIRRRRLASIVVKTAVYFKVAKIEGAKLYSLAKRV